jgi:hypothetical protein
VRRFYSTHTTSLNCMFGPRPIASRYASTVWRAITGIAQWRWTTARPRAPISSRTSGESASSDEILGAKPVSRPLRDPASAQRAHSQGDRTLARGRPARQGPERGRDGLGETWVRTEPWVRTSCGRRADRDGAGGGGDGALCWSETSSTTSVDHLTTKTKRRRKVRVGTTKKSTATMSRR